MLLFKDKRVARNYCDPYDFDKWQLYEEANPIVFPGCISSAIKKPNETNIQVWLIVIIR